jgi:hypothetical protein
VINRLGQPCRAAGGYSERRCRAAAISSWTGSKCSSWFPVSGSATVDRHDKYLSSAAEAAGIDSADSTGHRDPVFFPHRIVNTVGFTAAGAGFLLPFIGATTGTGRDEFSVAWQGTDLTVGGLPQVHMYGTELSSDDLKHFPNAIEYLTLPGQAGFIAAAVLILAGILAAFLIGRLHQTLTAGLSGAGATVLIGGSATAIMLQDPDLATKASFGVGFWLVFGLLATLSVVNLALAANLTRRVHQPAGATPQVDGEFVEVAAAAKA